MKPLSQRKLFLSGMILMPLISAQFLPAYGGGSQYGGGQQPPSTFHPISQASNPVGSPNQNPPSAPPPTFPGPSYGQGGPVLGPSGNTYPHK
jgi:hypothetical protein